MPSLYFTVSAGHIAMRGLHAIALFLESLADFLRNHHRSVLAAGTAEGDRQVALALVDVVRQKKKQHAGNAIQEFARLGKFLKIRNQFRMLAGKRPKLRQEMRIRQEAHIKDQISFQRNPVLIPKTER